MTPVITVRRGSLAFTLVELLVATAILLVILGVLVSMTNQASRVWQFGSAKVTAFQSSRFAFETMTRALSSATLNTYYDYYGTSNYGTSPTFRTTLNSSGTNNSLGVNAIFTPASYGRRSDLEFVCGKSLVSGSQITDSVFFQVPVDYTQNSDSSGYSTLGGLLNVIGFYIVFQDDYRIPGFVTSQPRYRYRLMELLQPTENFSVYSGEVNGQIVGYNWFLNSITNAPSTVRLLAENIVACIICPRLPTDPATTGTFTSSLTTDYNYDSVISNTAGTLNAQDAVPGIPPVNGVIVNGTCTWPIGQQQPTNMNQLPPAIRIVLVATDENSMIHAQGTSTAQPNLGFSYNNVFQNTKASGQFDADLATVTSALTSKHINYRIFQTDVAVRGAKWSP